ncbi:MAG TPA: hypothetical protein VIL48_15455 [Acidimicrobiales bacterium]
MTTVERATAAAGTVATDERVVVLPAEGEVTFGRSPNAALRIGHVPVYDDVVPRMAGRMLSCAGRVLVENLDETLAFDLRVTGRPLVTVPPGEVHGPRDRAFDILVAGTFRYVLAVTVNRDHTPTRIVPAGAATGEEPPTGARLRLTERQRRILDAYVAPLADGGVTAASHQQVAEAVGVSRALVRLECHRIWSEMLLAGVPMRALGDARDEVADAWARHRF